MIATEDPQDCILAISVLINQPKYRITGLKSRPKAPLSTQRLTPTKIRTRKSRPKSLLPLVDSKPSFKMSENVEAVRQTRENDENAFVARNRGKEAANGPTRRPALGTITNANKGRVQPGRAAKQSKTAFTIYSDDAENQPPPGASKTAAAASSFAATKSSNAPSKQTLKSQQNSAAVTTKASSATAAAATAASAAAAPSKAPAPARGFKVLEDKENSASASTSELAKESSKGLSSRAQDAVLSTFNAQQSSRNIPRAFQLKDQELDKDSPMKLDSSKIDSSLMQLEDSLPDIEDPDSKDDPVFDCPEYAADIYQYLLKFEQQTRPKPKYMAKQPDINMNMRAILVDWLVEVAEEYKLHDETLYLAVNYIDRFLSQMSVLRGKLQLVGTAAMFIAAKFEEIYPPELGEFVYITDDTYSKKQVLRMEHLILKVLNFEMATPTPGVYLRRFNKWVSSDDSTESLSRYLSELSLVDGDPFLQYSPSVVAGASVCLARHTLGHDSWPETLAAKAQMSFEDLKPCLEDLHKAYLNAGSHQQQAVREKYANAKHHQASTLNPPTSLPFC